MGSVDELMAKIPDLGHNFYIKEVNYLVGSNRCKNQMTLDDLEVSNSNTRRWSGDTVGLTERVPGGSRSYC